MAGFGPFSRIWEVDWRQLVAAATKTGASGWVAMAGVSRRTVSSLAVTRAVLLVPRAAGRTVSSSGARETLGATRCPTTAGFIVPMRLTGPAGPVGPTTFAGPATSVLGDESFFQGIHSSHHMIEYFLCDDNLAGRNVAFWPGAANSLRLFSELASSGGNHIC